MYYAPPRTESSSVRRADAGLIERGAIIVLDTVYVTRLSFADASTCEHALTPAIGMLKEMHDLSAPNKALQLQAALHAATELEQRNEPRKGVDFQQQERLAGEPIH